MVNEFKQGKQSLIYMLESFKIGLIDLIQYIDSSITVIHESHLILVQNEYLTKEQFLLFSDLLGKLSVRELERRGVCLLKLRCASQATGLYGRTVLTFEPLRSQGQEGKLPAHNFGPGMEEG